MVAGRFVRSGGRPIACEGFADIEKPKMLAETGEH